MSHQVNLMILDIEKAENLGTEQMEVLDKLNILFPKYEFSNAYYSSHLFDAIVAKGITLYQIYNVE